MGVLTKKDIVRQYLARDNKTEIDYEILYQLVTSQHDDWRRKSKDQVIVYLHTYVSQINRENDIQKEKEDSSGGIMAQPFATPTFRKKKDMVRHYLTSIQAHESVDYELLYESAISQFQDWKVEDKEKVIRWLKQYIYQISMEKLENEDPSIVDKDVSENELEDIELPRRGPNAKNAEIQQLGHDLLDELKKKMSDSVGNDDLYFLLNRFVWVRLRKYEDDKKKDVKEKLIDMNGIECVDCGERFGHPKKLHLHRIDENKSYAIENCEMLCKECHYKVHHG